MTQQKLIGKKIVLREMRRSDADAILEHLKGKEIKKYTVSIPHPYTRKHATDFLRVSRANTRKGEELHFAITLKDDTMIGLVSLLKISRDNRNAELGYWLSKKHWGKGLMTDAVSLIVNYAFSKLKLHKLYAGAFEENIASRRVLEKSGFRLEAVLKEQRFRFNRWHNEVRYGLIFPAIRVY